MAPIRTAIVGLSASAITSWASAAHLPYLLSARGREKYQIVALCNSSVEAAKRAIELFKLPPETKAYGDPQALADDKDVELVVVSTRVDVHYSTALPSAKAGKKVFVEWPLAHDVAHAKELVDAARAGGGRTLVGHQGREAPPILKLRQLLEQGSIGKVLSSEIRATGGTNDRETLLSGLKYFTDRSVGGNIVTIGVGHLFDQVQYILGDLQNIQSHLQLQRPNVLLRDPSTKEVVETVKSNVPDLVIINGTLAASQIAADGANVLFRFRRGQQFLGEPALSWSINGEKGEIRLQAFGGSSLHANSYNAPVTIEVHDFASDKLEQVDWNWQGWQEELPVVARSVGVLYEKFADGVFEGAPTFETALFRHEQLGTVLAGWDEK
ncbi:oxidoreductase family [Trichoderma arundinaceum]|uniref:Oxidoreductase family n=1 Tax=Trichoderma arundinaceum TaxID=490622 RepID=A0A395NFA2_TRIAR|nr:oxidoreductase family [Trichoderma arundinaceum]